MINAELLAILVCPVCKGKLIHKNNELWCKFDKLAYQIKNDIPIMLPDEARKISSEEFD